MKKILLFKGNKSLLTRLALLVMMIVGGGNNVWADGPYVTTLTFEDSSMPSGWSDKSGNANYVAYSGDYITTNGNYNIVRLTSSDKINLVSGQKIVIVAKTENNSSGAYNGIRYQHGSDFSKFTTTTGSYYDGTSNFPSTNTDCTITINIETDQNEYIAFWFAGRVKIKSIDFQAASGGSVTPPEDFSSSVTAFNSASLSWTRGGGETQWQIKYNAGSDFNPAEAGAMVDDNPVTTNPYTLAGLSGSTTYYAYIRAYIDAENQSEWVGPVSFTTFEQYPKPVSFALNSYTATTATFSWSNGAGTDASKWQIKYSESSGFDPASEGTLIDEITTNPYTITGLTAGTTYYARIRADYGSSHYSAWNAAEVSFTPIAAWETFDDGIPDTWYNSGFTTTRSGYEGQAFTTNTTSILRTPRLYAEGGQTLSYDITIGGSGSSYKITAQYSTDRISWTNVESAYTTSGTKTFTAPSTGYYWLKFSGYYCSVDNFNGFGPADVTHDMAVNPKSIPSTGTAHGDYTAQVEVFERGGSGETVTAELYFDGVKVAESEATVVAANRDQTMSLTFTPTVAKTANIYVKIIYNGDTELTTATSSVTISNTTYILDEDGDSQPTLSSRVLRVNYTAHEGWNTICMPFGLTSGQMDQLYGSGWKAYKISSYNNGILSFEKVKSALVTATPYLVYAVNVDEVEDEIYFKSVSIYSGSTGWASTNRTQTIDGATFQGTFVTKSYVAEDNWYGVTPAGKIMKAGSGAYVKGYRAYFTGISAPSGAPAEVKMFIIDGDDATDVGFVKMVDENAKEVYNLAGQKVQKGRKGIYIVNGKKVVIK